MQLDCKRLSLHSNLVIFKLTYIPTGQKIYFLYIPIWLYSNLVKRELALRGCFLYIPIWLYSNDLVKLLDEYFTFFTFQSGYIQIAAQNTITSNNLTFTFQSGYIQINSTNITGATAGIFTFQSGYIQIPLLCYLYNEC